MIGALLRRMNPALVVGLAPLLVLAVLAGLLVTWQWLASLHRTRDGAWRAAARVERFGPSVSEGECSRAPAGAHDIVHLGAKATLVQVGTDRGPCREDCRTVSTGVGLRPTQRTECKTVCDSKPRFEARDVEHCRWTVDEWQLVSENVTTGRGLGSQVLWPLAEAPLSAQKDALGAERITRSVRYEFTAGGLLGGEKICHFWEDEARWAALESGTWFRDRFSQGDGLLCQDRESACRGSPTGIPFVLCD